MNPAVYERWRLSCWSWRWLRRGAPRPRWTRFVRHQLGRRGRAWRIFPGRGRRHLQELRARRHHRAGRSEREQPHVADRRQARLLHGRQHADVVRRGRQQRADGDGRRDIPERSAGLLDPSRIQDHQTRRTQAADAVRVQGRHFQLFPVAEIRIRIQRRKGQALHLQSPAVSRRQQSAMQGYVTSEPFAIEKTPDSSRESSCWRITASTPIRP